MAERFRIIAAVLIALLLVGLTEVFLPSFLEKRLEKALRQNLPGVKYLRVDIQARPALVTLLGKFHTVEIDAKDFVIRDLPVEAFLLKGRQIRLEPVALYREGRVTIQQAEDLRLTVLLTQAGMNEYFWKHVDPAKRFHIELAPERARLVGGVLLLGRKIDVALNGVFEIRDHTRIAFLPEEFKVEKTVIPRFLLDALLGDRQLVLDLSGLPVPIVIDGVRVEEGQLYAFGHYEG